MRGCAFLSFVLTVAVLTGCGKSDAGGADVATAPSSITASPAVDASTAFRSGRSSDDSSGGFKLAANAVPTPRMVVRNAELQIRTEDLTAAEKKVSAIAVAEGGYLEASQGSDLSGPNPTVSVTIRVPARQFETAVAQFEGLGTRLGKTISSEDVTAQAVDLDARLKSLTAQENAYRTILSGARRIPDVLAVQEKLTDVRTTIEEIVAQRRTLGDQAAMSKIVVDLSESAHPAGPAPEPDWPSQTWGSATTDLRSVGRSLGMADIWLAAMIPVWLPIGIVASFAFRRLLLSRKVHLERQV